MLGRMEMPTQRSPAIAIGTRVLSPRLPPTVMGAACWVEHRGTVGTALGSAAQVRSAALPVRPSRSLATPPTSSVAIRRRIHGAATRTRDRARRRTPAVNLAYRRRCNATSIGLAAGRGLAQESDAMSLRRSLSAFVVTSALSCGSDTTGSGSAQSAAATGGGGVSSTGSGGGSSSVGTAGGLSSNGSTGGAGGGCSLNTCTAAVDCPFAACMTTNTATSYCYQKG